MIGSTRGPGPDRPDLVRRGSPVRARLLRRPRSGSARPRAAPWRLIAGFAIWVYTLLLPSFADAGWIGTGFIDDGPFGVGRLAAAHCCSIWNSTPDPRRDLEPRRSISACLIGFSLMRQPTPIERIQADVFVPRDCRRRRRRASGSVAPAVTVGRARSDRRPLSRRGTDGTRLCRNARGSAASMHEPKPAADVRTVRFAEHLLASAVGSASSRLVMALLLERHRPMRAAPSGCSTMPPPRSSTIAICCNRPSTMSDRASPSSTAIASLTCWNRQFRSCCRLAAEKWPGRRYARRRHRGCACRMRRHPAPKWQTAVADRIRRHGRGHEPFRDARAGGVIARDRSATRCPMAASSPPSPTSPSASTAAVALEARQ